MAKADKTKFQIPLPLEVEVWFTLDDKTDIGVAVYHEGNEIAKSMLVFEDLYNGGWSDDQKDSEGHWAHRKRVLRRMKTFVREKGFKMSRRDFDGTITDRTQPRHIMRVINGALKSCIDAHGPITHKSRSSAAKRVAKQFAALVRAAEQGQRNDSESRD